MAEFLNQTQNENTEGIVEFVCYVGHCLRKCFILDISYLYVRRPLSICVVQTRLNYNIFTKRFCSFVAQPWEL